MKIKFSVVMLCLAISTVLLLGTPAALAAEATKTTAVISSQLVFVDNNKVELMMYNIKDNNYVRLRDIGQAVGFNVMYDTETRAIHIKIGEQYSAESSTLGHTPQSVEVSQSIQTLYIDGLRTYITAYNIAGNNYVKLVDLGDAVGFSVIWDSTNRRVMVKSLNPQAVSLDSAQNIMPVEPETPAMTIEEIKLEIVHLTNIERVNAGLPALEILPELMDCAQAKADDMLENKYFSHTSPIFGTPSEMIRSYVQNVYGTGENIKMLIAWTGSVHEAFSEWMDSSGHRENILEQRFTHIGIGITIDETGRQKWVQQFCSMYS